MADSDGYWSYDDGYTLIEMVSGNTHYAELSDYERILDAFSRGMMPVLHFDDVFGAAITIRTDRIESIERQTPESLEDNARANEIAKHKQSKPSWMDDD